MQISGQVYALAALLPWKDYGTHWTGTGGWVSLAASLDILGRDYFPHHEVNLSYLALAILHTGWAILPYSIDQAIKCITVSSRSNYCQSKLAKYIILMPKPSCVQAYMWFYNSFLTNFKIRFSNWCSFSKQMTWRYIWKPMVSHRRPWVKSPIILIAGVTHSDHFTSSTHSYFINAWHVSELFWTGKQKYSTGI
jgi:hypothetical protein